MARSKNDPDETAAERRLLKFLGSGDYRPIPQRELLHRMNVPGDERGDTRGLIRRLVAEGKLRKIRGGRLVAVPDRPPEVHGVLERPRQGLSRVVPETGTEKMFVARHHLGGARSGDRVAVRTVGRGRDGRTYGEVVEILQEHRGVVLGLFRERGRGGVVQPFDPTLGDEIDVAPSARGDAAELHAVRLKIIKSPRRRSAREGQVLESLGHIDEPGTDVRVVSYKYELAIEFPEQVISAAEALPTEPDPAEAQRRERFDDPAPVTIDGETAQDFDDAIAVQELPRGGFRLFVHIADVAHYVPEDGTLDVEARRRGTSVYFPGTVLPMFPPTLSNGLCSLRPGEQRLVQSVILDLSARGEVRKVRFADGIIRSAARLNYTQVAAALQGKPTDRPLPASVLGMLEVADRLRELLERRRHARGSIDFDLPEPQILLDVEGVMTGIVVEPRNHAHRMIEEFMLVTNEAVASHLEGKNTACMYRVHDSPDPTKLSALARFVEGFGLQLNTDGETIEPGQIQRMLDRAQGRPEYRVISQVTLRSMRQARYTPENTGHFGLASPAYAHFTSPIRRYPDLVVHRQLRATRRGRPGRSESSLPLADVAESSSTLERNAEAAERELLVWKKVAFIAGSLGDEFDGIVTGVVRFGLFVQLVDNLVEGLVRVELLGEEWFEFDEGRFELRGTDSDKVYRLGDRIRVRVDRVDRPLLRVDFSPVQVARTGAPAGRGARGRARKRGKSSAR